MLALGYCGKFGKRGFVVARNRTVQKEKKRQATEAERQAALAAWKLEEEKITNEEKLDSKTLWGIKDPVPQEAVNNIIHDQLAS